MDITDHDDETLAAEFKALRGELHAKLRGYVAEPVPGLAVMSAPPPPPPAPPRETFPPAAAQTTTTTVVPPPPSSILKSRQVYNAPATAPTTSVSSPLRNTVLLQARKPNAATGSGPVLTQLGPVPGAKKGLASTRAPASQHASVSFATSRQPAAPKPAPIPPPQTTTTVSASAGASAASASFGHLAMRAALDSVSTHYYDARSALPMRQPVVPVGGSSSNEPKPRKTTKFNPPNLATAERARSTTRGVPSATWSDDIPGVVLEQLKDVAMLSGGYHGTSAVKRTGGGYKPKSPRPIPICTPATGGASGNCVSVPADQAPLFPVNAEGIPPTLETIRATERLVAAVATSNREAADAQTFDEGGESTMGVQYTEGIKGKPMSAQEAWAMSVDGEERQKEIVGTMRTRSAALHQNILKQLAQ